MAATLPQPPVLAQARHRGASSGRGGEVQRAAGAGDLTSAWARGGGGAMPKQSAGVLLFRRRAGELEVFLVHPGGPFWAKKDLGAWSIPKGEYEPDEDPLAAARREFAEEIGILPAGDFVTLSPVRQRSGKIVRAFAIEGDLDPKTITSNTFVVEWPPRSGKRREFPEIDRAGWFPLEAAKEKLISGQVRLVEELASLLAQREAVR
jgi:predicted NUDIX family NTP pyrophosphohydrolase